MLYYQHIEEPMSIIHRSLLSHCIGFLKIKLCFKEAIHELETKPLHVWIIYLKYLGSWAFSNDLFVNNTLLVNPIQHMEKGQ